MNHCQEPFDYFCIALFLLIPYLSNTIRWPLWRRQTAVMYCLAHYQSAPRTEWPSCLLTWKTVTSWCRGSLTSCSRRPPRSTSSERSQAASPAQMMRRVLCRLCFIKVSELGRLCRGFLTATTTTELERSTLCALCLNLVLVMLMILPGGFKDVIRLLPHWL